MMSISLDNAFTTYEIKNCVVIDFDPEISCSFLFFCKYIYYIQSFDFSSNGLHLFLLFAIFGIANKSERAKAITLAFYIIA
jgi:hypothetical protein